MVVRNEQKIGLKAIKFFKEKANNYNTKNLIIEIKKTNLSSLGLFKKCIANDKEKGLLKIIPKIILFINNNDLKDYTLFVLKKLISINMMPSLIKKFILSNKIDGRRIEIKYKTTNDEIEKMGFKGYYLSVPPKCYIKENCSYKKKECENKNLWTIKNNPCFLYFLYSAYQLKNLDEIIIFLLAHEFCHYLIDSKQIKLNNFEEIQCDEFGYNWLKEFKDANI